MIAREAIAVYQPDDPWEQAIQDSSKEYTGQWLSMYRCQLVAKAIAGLKSIDDWMSQPELFASRAKYFFAPHFVAKRDQMVFVTHFLFLRDILENREINAYLHDPVTFVTPPIAHYLLRQYPIHIVADYDKLKSENDQANFIEVGGLLLVDGQNIKLSKECILDIVVKENDRLQATVEPSAVQSVVMQTGMKAAMQLSRGVFSIDKHERVMVPGMSVWDKEQRKDGTVYLVEPGDTGVVGIQYKDGAELTISKLFFDSRFVVV